MANNLKPRIAGIVTFPLALGIVLVWVVGGLVSRTRAAVRYRMIRRVIARRTSPDMFRLRRSSNG